MFQARQIYQLKDGATQLKGERSLEEVWESHGKAAPRSPVSLFCSHSTRTCTHQAAAGQAHALVTEVLAPPTAPLPCIPLHFTRHECAPRRGLLRTPILSGQRVRAPRCPPLPHASRARCDRPETHTCTPCRPTPPTKKWEGSRASVFGGACCA